MQPHLSSDQEKEQWRRSSICIHMGFMSHLVQNPSLDLDKRDSEFCSRHLVMWVRLSLSSSSAIVMRIFFLLCSFCTWWGFHGQMLQRNPKREQRNCRVLKDRYYCSFFSSSWGKDWNVFFSLLFSPFSLSVFLSIFSSPIRHQQASFFPFSFLRL